MTNPATPNPVNLHELARRAMFERGLEPDFPPAAEAELAAAALLPAVPDAGVRNLRDMAWCSIDNDDSRDLDQLTVAEALGDGSVKLLVAIADVDHAVAPGSALDAHARANTTSVYTAGGTFSMLPERLSTDLTSLNEREDRVAIVIEMLVAADGSVGESSVYRAIVNSQAKLAYDSVAAWLDDEAPAPAKVSAVPGLDAQLRLQDQVAQGLKRLQQHRGTLGLATPTARPVFENGILTDLRADDKNRAKELISVFMIAANGATARFLAQQGFPSLRRVLRAPQRWDRLIELAAATGDVLPTEPSAAALNAFLIRRRDADPEKFPELSLAVVKLLGSGEYVAAKPGQASTEHFGLAVSDYTHSTAPNRRYPDLVTQRLLKAALAGQPVPYGDSELAALASHCTLQEDNAAKVERQVRKSAAALLLSTRVGETFSAIVTGASAKGTWVRTSKPIVEGRIVQGFEGLDVADKVRVELLSVDVERGFIDFRRTAPSPMDRQRPAIAGTPHAA